MKFLALSAICFVFVIGVCAFPKLDSHELVVDSAERKIIDDQFTILDEHANNTFVSGLLKSIDRKCMVAKYKNHKLADTMLTEEAINFATFSPEKPVDPLLVFINIGVTCSNKLDAVLEFVFDNLFSYSGLISAFKDEEPFKDVIDKFACFNKYSVETKVINHETYPQLPTKLVNQTQEECDEEITEARSTYSGLYELVASNVVTDHEKCLKKEIAAHVEKIFLRYVLLVPLGLNDGQKHEEKIHFVHDTRAGLESILACNAHEKEERSGGMLSMMMFLQELGLEGYEDQINKTLSDLKGKTSKEDNSL